jgi:hypothetical protein
MQHISFISIAKRVVVLTLILSLNFSRGALGQTEGQLGSRFKKLVAFEIRPGIVAFPTFSIGGNVCRLTIQKMRPFESRNSDSDQMIPSTLVDQLVDEVVPPAERGRPSKYLSTESYISGGAAFIKQDYENVSVSIYGTSVVEKANGATLIIIAWRNRTCPSNTRGL